MSKLQEIAKSLMGTVEGDTKSIKKAQQQLRMLSSDKGFLSTLLSIPQMQDIKPLLARVASVYTLTYARHLVEQKNQSLINISAELMLSFISNNAIDFKYKDQVGAALEYLIGKDNNNIIISAFVPNTIQLLKAILNGSTQLADVNIQALILISEVMSDRVSPSNYQNAVFYVSNSFGALSYLVNKMIEFMGSSNMISNDQAQAEKVLLYIVKMIKVLKKYIKKFMYYEASLVEVLYNENYHNMVNALLNLNLPENILAIPLFYLNQAQVQNPSAQPRHKIIQYFHVIKSNCVYILSQSVRVLVNTKYSSYNIQQSIVLQQCPQMITLFVKSVDELLQKLPYYKLNSKLQLKIIEEVYNYLLVCLRTCRYYQILSELKPIIIFSLIFKTLAFCPADYDNYYHDPEQYVNSLLQVIQVNVGALNANDKPQVDQSQVDIQLYGTLKTVSANLLKNYTKYIDGTLSQILLYIINVLDDKINLEISKNLLYLMACVLRDEIRVHGQGVPQLRKIVYKNLQELEVPEAKVEQPYNIEYTLNLLVVSRYLIIFDELIDESIIGKTYDIIEKLLKNNKVQKAPKIILGDLILAFLRTEEGMLECRNIIQMFNDILSVKQIYFKHLVCIQEIIKNNDMEFKDDYKCLIELCEKISSFLQYLLKSKSKLEEHRVVIDQLWHIIEQIVDSRQLGVPMADTLRRILQPLIYMIDGNNQPELEEKVYEIMRNIVRSTLTVGQFQLQILTILPKTFYVGLRKGRLQTAFSLLQHIIFYGKQILSTDLLLVRSLILLCIENISQKTINDRPCSPSDCLQGVFTIQSLILSVGSIFTQQIWVTITRTLTSKLEQTKISCHLVKGTIVSTLSLIVSMAYPSFPMQDCEQLMQILAKQHHNLNNSYLCKLYVISMCNLLQNYNLGFINHRFNHLLDISITFLKMAPSLLKLSADDKQLGLDQEMHQFAKLKNMLLNCFDQLDEYDCFKNTVYAIKTTNSMLLEGAYNDLPQEKKNYLRDVLNSKKINDQVRVIYKLKRAP